ncbi:MAG TPA: hypothetical protein VIM58_00410, partial [Candidatus Methylacidiphilales bacterium]
MGTQGLQEKGTVAEETRIVSWPEPLTSLSLPRLRSKPKPSANPGPRPEPPRLLSRKSRAHRFAGWTALI